MTTYPILGILSAFMMLFFGLKENMTGFVVMFAIFVIMVFATYVEHKAS